MKLALRMTRGPTNACIDFHCDGGYATCTSQIALNDPSEYKGGRLCFFVNDHLHVLERPAGSIVQHPPKVLHGVTALTEGTRKSLFLVDRENGLGHKGVVETTKSQMDKFLAVGSINHVKELEKAENLSFLSEFENMRTRLDSVDNTHQFVMENQNVLASLVQAKCTTEDDEAEQHAILASDKHREFYILLNRKLYCMITSCETLSSGMVLAGNGESFLSFTSELLKKGAMEKLKDTKLGSLVGHAIEWARNNVLATIPIADTVASIFKLIVTLNVERDRYLGIARVADFATIACLPINDVTAGSTTLRSCVEKVSRLMVRARHNLPGCAFVEEKKEFGKIKQFFLSLLADSTNSPTKEQASKAADCIFAHIMQPNNKSTLQDILEGKRTDICLDVALAAAVLNVTIDEVRGLHSFDGESPSTGNDNHTSTIRSYKCKLSKILKSPSTVDHTSSSLSHDEVEVKEQLSLLKDKVALSEKRTTLVEKRLSTIATKPESLDAGGGLVFADSREKYKNDVDALKKSAVVGDDRACEHAIKIQCLEEKVKELQYQLNASSLSRESPSSASDASNSSGPSTKKRRGFFWWGFLTGK